MRNLDDTLLFSPNRINVAVSCSAVQALVSGEDVWRWCLALVFGSPRLREANFEPIAQSGPVNTLPVLPFRSL